MRRSAIRAILPATVVALAACDGGGVAFIPAAPTPEAQPGIIQTATTSQEFAVMGDTIIDGFGSTLDSSVQIRVRYDAPTQAYQVFLPDGLDWQAIHYDLSSESAYSYSGPSVLLGVSKTANQYSQLISWNDGANSGRDAVGILTSAGDVPVTGTATYSGQILGVTSEHHAQDFTFGGSIALAFDFGAGSLAGSITPNLQQGYDAGTLNFRDTVYSAGDTKFSGTFDTDVAGVNTFSGQFTGPQAEELIGNFAIPYRSSIDQLTYQANGAFIGKK